MWDYVEITKNPEKYPASKLHIPWPNGGGETVWVRSLGESLFLLDNDPLYSKYRSYDVVKSDGRTVGEIVFRTFPNLLRYSYRHAESKEEDLEIRKRLHEAGVKAGGVPAFFIPGRAFISLKEGVKPEDVKRAMSAVGVETAEWHLVVFNEKTGEGDVVPV